MEFIRENFEVLMTIGVVAMITMISIVIGFNRYLLSYYISKKFNIDAKHEIDAKSGQSRFTINLYNRNINDVRISGFGFIYKNHNIDFYNKYIEVNHLQENHKIVISSRDYIDIYILVKELKAIIYEINKGSYRVKRVDAYVTDSLGLTTTKKSKRIRRILKQELKNDYKKEKEDLKAIKRKETLERKRRNIQNRKEKKLLRQEKYKKIKLSLKMTFKKIINLFKRRSKSK